MKLQGLSNNSRKALSINIGDQAGTEIADLLAKLVTEVEELRRTKVSITRIVPQPTGQSAPEYIEEPV